MNFMKRWTASIATSFDWVISQVENHEALVSAALREMQSAGAKARVQLERVRRDGGRMDQRARELQEMQAIWNERAVRVAQEDRDRALECIRRRRELERELRTVEEQRREHARVQEQLGSDLKLIDERIGELKRKKNTLSARQYRAEALKAGQLSELGIIGEIDEIFDRWEMKIGVYESSTGNDDNFSEQFVSEESRIQLEAELDQLVAGTTR